ncbi:hypothetical protein PIB30_075344 [Stylosanthes scabra]|uniref:Protein kinase domain-containing protein n=1 Tax=Stylosanthes scabra TaxID=79078 RepID=A0ABU6VR29_9FABA|nr:hypothetical protein [Stylosanthes scabra]
MAAALECWSSRATTTTDDDMVEQVLMRSHHRSEALTALDPPSSSSSSSSTTSTTTSSTKDSNNSIVHKKLQKLSRNVSEAIASLKNTLNIQDSNGTRDPLSSSSSSSSNSSKIEGSRKVVWGCVVRNLTQLYPGSQLPEKLMSNIRKHYDSLPLSYAQADFDMKDVFLHIKLMEQASANDYPAILIQEESDDGGGCDVVKGFVLKLTFACNSPISWPAMSSALDSSSISCKKVQIFEKKGFTIGIVLLVVHQGQEKLVRTRVENALRFAMKKSKTSSVKLPFGLCGCQEEISKGRSELGEIEEDGSGDASSCYMMRDFENSSQKIQLQVPLPSSSFVVSVDEWQTIKSGCNEIEKWVLNSDNVEFLEQIGPNSYKGFYNGKRVGIEKLKGCDKGNAYEFELRKDLLELMTCGHRNILQFVGICVDDNHGLCVVTKFMEGGSVHDFLLKNKKIHAKDIIIAGDPESVTETWMSNVYSFGMVIWEMVTGEAAYSALSPVQAAVGIAACGLRPEIPKDCPQTLKSIMTKCWNNTPSKRPQFSEILVLLLRPNSINR